MRLLWLIGGGLAGLVAGVVTGFAVALAAMSFSTPRHDGTYGMLEMIVCLPGGAILGLVAGLAWGLTTKFGGR